MGILNGFLRTKRYRRTTEGYIWQSEDTHESSVKFDDGTTLTDKMTEIQEKMTKTTESLNSHEQSASTITAGTFKGKVLGNATSAAALGEKQFRNIYAGTDELKSGTSSLTTGNIYIQYE